MRKHRFLAILNLIFTSIVFISGILFFLFNLLGKWIAWHYAGFATVILFRPAFVISVIELYKTVAKKNAGTNKSELKRNIVLLAVNIVVYIFSVTISQRWFW